MEPVDVLVVTALPEEFAAAQAAAGPARPGAPGIREWQEHAEVPLAPYVAGEYLTADGRRLSVALARPLRMGVRAGMPLTTTLTDRLRPTCLAMSGVCAGNPLETASGDVVVAETVYQYDEGRVTDAGFVGDHRQYPQDARWLRHAQEFDPAGLPSHGPASELDAGLWFLERLHLEQDPRTHPARARYFPTGTWHPRLEGLRHDGLIRYEDGDDPGWRLTADGTARITRLLDDDVDGPATLPFAVVAGPIASGSAVVTEAGVWDRLRGLGVRRVAALEMEAAMIATVAHQRQVPHWLVAKGVMDRADKSKSDRFRNFAARASAEVLYRLLTDLLPGRPAAGPSFSGRTKVQVLRMLVTDWPDLADAVGVPAFARARFPIGDQPRALWEWLESRSRLDELPEALDFIGRGDLAALLRAG